ncbi:MAG: MGMT family protein [Crocinitomicaceae bacterium]
MASDFYQNVFDVVKEIPKGRVTSYGAIAKYLGAARSSRLVGWAMNISHKQKDSIPAHRVVNRNGLLTAKMNFTPPSKMAELLNSEGVEVIDDQIQNFKTVFWDPEIELG